MCIPNTNTLFYTGLMLFSFYLYSCYGQVYEPVDSLDLKSVWRFCFRVERVKATEYTGVKNR